MAVEEEVALPMAKTDPEVVANRILEAASLLLRRAMTLGEGREEGDEVPCWEEGEGFGVV